MESLQAATSVTASPGLGWTDLAKIVLASGVVATLIGWLKDGVFKWRDRARAAKYTAIGLIARLDLYALQSRTNQRNYRDSAASLEPHRDYMHWPSCAYPDFHVSDEELRGLDPELASNLAWIATEKVLANLHLHAIDDDAHTPMEVYDHESEVVGYFGYEAYLLALKLRDKFSLPSFGKRWGIDDEFSDLLASWMKTKAEVSRLNRRRQPSED